MNTTLQLDDALVFVGEGGESLVALVGFRHRLGSSAMGLFERCQLRVLDLAAPEDAIRLFETIAPDVVVVDSHHEALKLPSEPAIDLLRAVCAQRQECNRKIPLVLLNSAGVAPEVRSAFVNAGAILVPAQFQAYRHLIQLVRRLCGLAQSCCAIGDLPNSFFNADATTSLHPRH